MAARVRAMSRPRVLVLGNTTVDHVFRLPAALAVDAKVQSERYDVYAGGQAANVAIALALLGWDVVFIGRFGDDPGAAISRRAFSDAGVDLRMASSVADCRHHTACILVSGGARSIVMHRDPRLALDDIAIAEDTVAGCAAVYTDGHEGAASLRLAGLAATLSVPLVMDIEVLNAQTLRLAAYAGHLIAPAQILRQLARCDDAETAVRALVATGPAAVVATMGGDGAVGIAVGDGDVVRMAAAPCAIVDTTGAGDAFHAGYLAALLRGEPLRERLRFASALAAAKCGIAGPCITAQACAQVALSW